MTRKKTILIVDDDSGVLHLLKKRFDTVNLYDVVTAKDGKEGLRIAVEHQPDLIVLDVMMPHQSGGETARLLKENIATRHIPIVFMTVLLEAGGRKRFEINDQEYRAVSKPVYLPELLAQIRKAMNEAEHGS